MPLQKCPHAVDGADLQVRRLLPEKHRDLGVGRQRGDATVPACGCSPGGDTADKADAKFESESPHQSARYDERNEITAAKAKPAKSDHDDELK
jgi:hypothetical protein